MRQLRQLFKHAKPTRRLVLFLALLIFALTFVVGVGARLRSAFFQDGDIGVIKTGPETAAADTDLTYTISVSTLGPDNIDSASLHDDLPAGMTFVSLDSSGAPGWICSSPSPGAGGAVDCSSSTAPADSNFVFTLTVHTAPEIAPGTFLTNIATVNGTPNNNDENDSSTATVQVPSNDTDLTITKTGPPQVHSDSDVSYTITVANTGSNTATNAQFTDTLPNSVPSGSQITFVSFTQDSGPIWNDCTVTNSPVVCKTSSLAAGTTSTFTLVGHVPPSVPDGYQYTNQALLTSDSDPNSENDGSSTVATASSCFIDQFVTTNADSGPGSLRQAILDACPGSTISFDMTQVVSPIALTSGELLIDKTLTIVGPGAGLLTVQRSTGIGTSNFRIFETAAVALSSSISGMTISNGRLPNGASGSDGGSGGGILNNAGATLNLNGVVISGNQAGAAGSGGYYGGFGGGIANLGTLTLSNSTVANNTAGSGTGDGNTGGSGGGISNGGLSSNPGTLTILNSTVSGNSAGASSLNGGSGGGISNNPGSAAGIQNSTISGNSAGAGCAEGCTGGKGGGIYNAGGAMGSVTLVSTTVTANQSGAGNIGGDGGGVFNADSTTNLRNTIVAGNTVAAGGQGPDFAGSLNSQDNNLITDPTGAAIIGATSHNIINQDAKLGPLANNGGTTQTHPLLAGSPALDAGDNCVTDSAHCSDANVSQVTSDQRGLNRQVDGPDADLTATVDIGAFEAQVSIEDISDKSTNEDTQLQFIFNLGGSVTSVTATSSNTILVPNNAANISLSGSGSTRTLTINPTANEFGTSIITVTVSDNNGESMTDTFVLTVNSANDAPSFTSGPDQTINEDASTQSIPGWATNISAGPANEAGQQFSFLITGNTNPTLFSSGPAISSNGTLSYAPAPNANGSATITVVLQDDGGTANGGQDTSAPQTFNITVNPVDDVPSFTKGPDQTVNEDASTQSISNWATNISAGPANESGQQLSFLITGNTNPTLFSIAPAIASNGRLTYTPAADANGSANITVVLQDDGGTANGGQNTSAPQSFTITVNAINDVPSFTKGPDQTVVVNAGAQTVSNWATNISAGASNESGQALTFQVTGNTNNALFSAQPAISSTGTLTYTPATNGSGSATITINLKDNGGTTNGGVDTSPSQTFTITVNCGSTVVTNSNDGGAGSLRDTILHACTGATITFDMNQVVNPITLTSGQLTINNDLTIQGPGANTLTVQRSIAAGTPQFRIFSINSGRTVSLSGLTIRNGDLPNAPGNDGAGISNQGTLTLSACAVNGNATPRSGGGVVNSGSSSVMTISGCTISGNSAGFAGSGIANGGTLTVTNSTIINNATDGLSNLSPGVVTLVNDTFSGNTVRGISNSGGATVNIGNTIVANTPGGAADVSGSFSSLGNNLIGSNPASTGFTNGVNGDKAGTAGSPLNPRLAPLANYGGTTDTMALLPGSPAIDAGRNAAIANPPFSGPPFTDQRGTGFNRTVNGTVDIGAFESRGFTISVFSGSPQSATILSPFASPLVAAIGGVGGEPVNGGVITFTAPAANASAVLTGGGATANVTIAGGQASTNATANGTAGSYNVVASASGATAASFALTNTKAATTTTVASSVNPSDFNQNVTFTATVSSVAIPTGTVQFKDNGVNLGSPVALNASGVAQLTTSALTTGTHTITADYSGDGNFLASTGTLPGGQKVLFRPLIKFSQPTYSVNENGNFITITVVRSGDTSLPVTVDYTTPDDSAAMTFVPCSTASGIASPRCDFNTALGTFRFAAGETSKTFDVLISQDSWVEGNETATLTLSNPTGGAAFQQPSDANSVLTIVDDDLSQSSTNPIDVTDVFVRQQYHDFLNREPDGPGFTFWKDNIDKCNDPNRRPPNQTATQCLEVQRINTSAAFFLSIEFQNTGYFVERIYKAGLGDISPPTVPVPVRFTNFIVDTQEIGRNIVVGQGNWQAQIDANKRAFAQAFVQRPAFLNRYPSITSATAFVDGLNANAGMVLSDSERANLIAELAPNPADTTLRADVLLKVAENAVLFPREFNRAFVLMQYFGYLRRNPDAAPESTLNFNGYNFWLGKLNQFNGDYIGAELIKAFVNSGEYRGRFGP